MRTLDALDLTLREAHEAYAFHDELKATTKRTKSSLLTKWEKLTGDPKVKDIDNETVERFRAAMLDHGYTGQYVNCCWRTFKTILRRLGPQETGNPSGLGILDRVPYMRPCKCSQKLPRRVPLEDISKFYIACRHAETPRNGHCSPAEWWRALIVMAYCTGFRRSDLFELRWRDIDLQEGVVHFEALKTGKQDLFPLHHVAVAHLNLIQNPNREERVFRGLTPNCNTKGGRFYDLFHELRGIAGVDYFTLRDMRKTGGSEVERVAPGMGPTFLQHAPRTVSDKFYLNRSEELREAIDKMRLPDGFRSGPKVYQKREQEQRQARMTHVELYQPSGPVLTDWSFSPGAFAYQGQWFKMPSPVRWAVLRKLATTEGPVTWQELDEAIRETRKVTGKSGHRRVIATLTYVRQRLRECLGLRDDIDPIPCVMTGENAAYTLWIREGTTSSGG